MMPEFQPGDFVAIKGQTGSKLEVVSYSKTFGKYTVKNSFGGRQDISPRMLVRYGSDTGAESPMGGRAVNPDVHKWFR
jgi:signal peptidase I